MRQTRLRLWSLIMLLVGFAVCAGVLLGSDHGPQGPMQTVVVAPGDTLWEIAVRHGPQHQDVRATVDEMLRANRLTSSRLVVGQELLVPSER